MILTILILFGLCFFISILIAPFEAKKLKREEAHLVSVKVLDTSGKRVSFEIVTDDGNIKIETVKIGSARYTQLRSKCL